MLAFSIVSLLCFDTFELPPDPTDGAGLHIITQYKVLYRGCLAASWRDLLGLQFLRIITRDCVRMRAATSEVRSRSNMLLLNVILLG